MLPCENTSENEINLIKISSGSILKENSPGRMKPLCPRKFVYGRGARGSNPSCSKVLTTVGVLAIADNNVAEPIRSK